MILAMTVLPLALRRIGAGAGQSPDGAQVQ